MIDTGPEDSRDAEFISHGDAGPETAADGSVIAQDHVVAGPAQDGLVALAPDDHIIPGTGIDGYIRAAQTRCPYQRNAVQVDPGDNAGDGIVVAAHPAIVAEDDVVAGTARNGELTLRPADDDVIARTGRDAIGARMLGERGDDLSAHDDASVVAENHVIALAAVDGIIAESAHENVIAARRR